jgi:hypothetical protein
MIKDILQKVKCGTGVWSFNEVTQLVERRIPLKSLFVQEWDASTMSRLVKMNQEDSIYAHFGC